jgi:hypothetical protein
MDSFMLALEEALLETSSELVPLATKPQGCLVVTDTESAAAVVEKKAAIRMLRELELKLHKDRLAELDSQDQRIDYLVGNTLEAWCRANLPTDIVTKKIVKHINLGFGVVRFRNVKENITVEDEKALLEWAKTNAPAVYKEKLYVSVNKTELNELWKKTGEVPPGCDVCPQHETFFIE